MAFTLSCRDDRYREVEQGRSRDVCVESPSWSEIEAAIRRLDGEHFTSVGLECGGPADPCLMALSGGRDSRVVCSIARPEAPDGPDEHFLVEIDRGDGTFIQPVAGAATALPARFSVARARVLQAARHFFAHDGAADPTLDWEQG